MRHRISIWGLSVRPSVRMAVHYQSLKNVFYGTIGLVFSHLWLWLCPSGRPSVHLSVSLSIFPGNLRNVACWKATRTACTARQVWMKGSKKTADLWTDGTMEGGIIRRIDIPIFAVSFGRNSSDWPALWASKLMHSGPDVKLLHGLKNCGILVP